MYKLTKIRLLTRSKLLQFSFYTNKNVSLFSHLDENTYLNSEVVESARRLCTFASQLPDVGSLPCSQKYGPILDKVACLFTMQRMQSFCKHSQIESEHVEYAIGLNSEVNVRNSLSCALPYSELLI